MWTGKTTAAAAGAPSGALGSLFVLPSESGENLWLKWIGLCDSHSVCVCAWNKNSIIYIYNIFTEYLYVRTYTISVGILYDYIYILHKSPVHIANLSENNSKSVQYGWPKSIKVRHQGAVSEITLTISNNMVSSGFSPDYNLEELQSVQMLSLWTKTFIIIMSMCWQTVICIINTPSIKKKRSLVSLHYRQRPAEGFRVT